jgi:hypothetical protein
MIQEVEYSSLAPVSDILGKKCNIKKVWTLENTSSKYLSMLNKEEIQN